MFYVQDFHSIRGVSGVAIRRECQNRVGTRDSGPRSGTVSLHVYAPQRCMVSKGRE